MPPPVTPSPHRFLDGASRRKTSPEKQGAGARRPSYLARDARPHEQHIERPDRTPQRSFAPPAASQFAPTPRFSASRPKPAQAVRPASPPKASFVQALRSTRPREDVEDDGVLGDDGDGDEMLLDAEQCEALPTTEYDGYESQPQQMTELPYSPKRRRIGYDVFETPGAQDTQRLETGTAPSHATFKPPPDPSILRSSRTTAVGPRFAPPSPPSSRARTPASEAFTNRPNFLRPSPAQQEASTEPLPEAFSPHRRGQKFVSGGMAATVQQWVVETGQAAVQSRRGQRYLKGEDFVVKVRIDVVSGDGPWLLHGKHSGEEDVSLLLAGTGTGTNVEPGAIVGVRAPTWKVELEGRQWQVAVDWRVL